MQSNRVKVFKDSVHGYISIPEVFVSSFIDTDLFQRLRNIEQTGMRILFPSARHDRFIHSLGVYYLGHKAFKCFKKNVQISYPETHYKVKTDEKENELFWRECQLLFEIACLLHDCGHAPFSHTFEYAYDLEPEGSTPLRDKLLEYIGSDSFHNDYSGDGGPHEVMSALLVCSEYSDAVEKVLKEDAGEDTPVFRIREATEFIVRMIIGCVYRETDEAHQLQNCMINLLNSKSIDVDSLDYIIRDSQMSGVQNMGIDVDRLLQSLTVVEVTIFNNASFRNRDINAIVIDGKLCSLDRKSASFEGRFAGKTDLSGNNSVVLLTQGAVCAEGEAKVMQDCKLVSGEHVEKRIFVGGSEFETLPQTRTLGKITVEGFLDGEMSLEGVGLTFSSDTNAQGRIQSPEIKFSSVSLSGQINGKFSGKALGNQTCLSSRNAQTALELGFHKSSLSVIQNVIIARNYEYQWTYSHHKVVYYANYLEIELLRQCIRFILERNKKSLHATDEIQKILSWKTMITPTESETECRPYDLYGLKFWRPTDADFLNLFNYCYVESSENDEVRQYLYEYRNRRFKKSLWKSYAEMCIFFEGFTKSQIKDFKNMLVEYSTDKKEDKKEDREEEGSSNGYRFNEQYGYPKTEFCEGLYKLGLDKVVWVSGDSKLKELDPVSTYIHFKDRDMTYGSVSSPNDIRSIRKLDLFYIYYTPVDGVEINISSLQSFFKDSLEKWKKERREKEKDHGA